MKFRYLRAPDGAEGTGSAASAVAPPAAAPVAAAAPPAPQAVPTPAPAPHEPPHYANVRESERRKVLKEMGYKPAKGVPAAQAIADAKESIKSQKERRRAAETERDTAKARIVELESRVEAIKQFAAVELAGLDDKQRDLVKTLAGEDPSEQLRQIAAIRMMSLSQAPVAAPAPAVAPVAVAPVAVAAAPAAPAPVAAPIPPPAQSAPAQPGPVPTNPGAPIDVIAEVKRLAKGSVQDQLQARLLILQNVRLYGDSAKFT